MKKSFAVAALCLSLLALPAFAAQSKGLALPIGGNFTDAAGGTGTFAGTFVLQQFAVVDNQLVGQGVLTGTMTSSTGAVLGSVYRQVALPVSFPTGTASSEFAKSSNALGGHIGISATCEILHLDLGPLSLNLLGLQVNLSEVVLDISAQSGPGNLLGNLLCAVANLLNGGLNLSGVLGQISTLLNQILGVLAGL